MPNHENESDIGEWIANKVSRGEWNFGHSVNERELTEAFQLSRHKVRESLNILCIEGILEKKPNKGYFVVEYDTSEAHDGYRVRANLAYLAGQLLAERISLDALQTLRQLHSQMVSALERMEIEQYFVLNKQLHDVLFEATKCAPLIQFNKILQKKLSLFLHKEMNNPIGLKLSNQEHLALINHIAEGNAKAAATCFEQHILKGIKSL
ncbi:GntR family transcriptional regulator [Vibrio nitrifigilis]|uniref:GntR family transcriptional regulator n=1 Tax=Vibrio nitrifigilis TaxID=2789781 RepID=A0ABS0GIK4_9VIBR|nr:GntR family transcriptional regulator [Vibrio nitrifigilis]MBF9002172.1 GntR family transcriptional regulator [Vibrio nitrifigilis]